MTTWWLVASFLKFLGALAWSAGILGAVAPGRSARRLSAGLHLGTLGLLLTWFGGYGLLKASDQSLSEPYVLESLLISLTALTAAWWAASLPRPGVLWTGLPIAGLAATVGGMVTRAASGEPIRLALMLVIPLLLGAAAGSYLSAGHDPDEHDVDVVRAVSHGWWTWLARAEGTSLLLLLGFVTPLKRIADVHLDPGGYVGWVHGGLVMAYVASLVPMARWHGWPLSRVALAFVASLLPFGTFAFERRYLGAPPAVS